MLRIFTLILAVSASSFAESPVDFFRLKYPTLYAETGAVFSNICKQELVKEFASRQATLVQVFDATEKPLQHSGSKADTLSGSYAPEILRGSSGAMMLWGPYAEFEKGNYLVVYRHQVLEEGSKGTFFFDVAHNACTRSGIRLDAAKMPFGKWLETAVPVHLTQKTKLEFRFWPDRIPVALDRIYVFKVKGDTVATPDLGLLPKARVVDGRKDVVRSPHTQDSGLIDVSGLRKGAKVRCPYTGKFFRVP